MQPAKLLILCSGPVPILKSRPVRIENGARADIGYRRLPSHAQSRRMRPSLHQQSLPLKNFIGGQNSEGRQKGCREQFQVYIVVRNLR